MIIYIIYIHQASLSEVGQVFMRIPEDGDRTLYFGLALCFKSKVECTTKVRAIFFQIKPVFSNSKQLVVSCSSNNKNEIMLCFWSYFYLHDHRYINCLSMIRYEQNLLPLNCYTILKLPKHLDNQDHFQYLKQPLKFIYIVKYTMKVWKSTIIHIKNDQLYKS